MIFERRRWCVGEEAAGEVFVVAEDGGVWQCCVVGDVEHALGGGGGDLDEEHACGGEVIGCIFDERFDGVEAEWAGAEGGDRLVVFDGCGDGGPLVVWDVGWVGDDDIEGLFVCEGGEQVAEAEVYSGLERVLGEVFGCEVECLLGEVGGDDGGVWEVRGERDGDAG